MKAASKYIPSISFNGSTQYVRGVNGSEGFEIADFVSAAISFTCVINLNNAIFNTTTGAFVLDMPDTGNINGFSVRLGNATGTFPNEYIYVVTSSGSFGSGDGIYLPATARLVITVVCGLGGSSTRKIYINGIEKTTLVNGGISATETSNSIVLGCRGTLQSFLGYTGREFSFFKRYLTQDEVVGLHNWYLSKSNASLESHALFQDPDLIELYTGKKNATHLLASKSPATHNLKLFNI